MRRIIKIAAALCIAVLCACTLCACHGSKGMAAFELPESFDTSREYEITFWSKNDNNNQQVEVYNNAVKSFEALYPNIHVTMKRYTDYAKIYNDVITNISTNTTPNVCITYPDHIATYLTGENIVVPLEDLIKSEKYGLGGSEIRFDGAKDGEIIDKYLNECVLSGRLYALPFIRSTEALYINSELVERLGFTVPDVPTWDWIWEVSEAATEKNADGTYKLNGQNVMIPFIYKSTDNMMITYLKQLDAPYSNENGDNLLFNDAAGDFLKEIAEHVSSGAFSTFKISSYPGNSLNCGQAVFGIDSTAGSTWMGSNACNQDIDESELQDLGMIVRPIPQIDPENPLMISQGPSICIFNKQDPQEVLAAWLFAQYLLTNDTQIGYSTTEGYLPVTTKALESEEYNAYLQNRGKDNRLYYDVKIDATKLVLNSIDNTFITPVFNGSASLRDAAGQLIEETAKAVRRNQKVDERFIDELYGKINSLYRLDQHQEGAGGKTELGPLPLGARALLLGIGGVWICIAIFALLKYNKSRKTR